MKRNPDSRERCISYLVERDRVSEARSSSINWCRKTSESRGSGTDGWPRSIGQGRG